MKLRVALVSITLAVFLIIGAFFSVYYDRGPAGIYARQPWSEEQQAQVSATLAFLNEQESDLSFYTERESSHLADVRRLLDVLRLLFGLAFALLVAQAAIHYYWCKKLKQCRCKPLLRKMLLYGGVGALGFVILLALASLFDFTSFWMAFHKLLFPRGNYLFAMTSTLIALFPQRFFEAYAREVLLAIGTFALLSLLTSWSLRTESNS